MHRRERVGDLEVAFDDQGHGRAVVMLHPFPFDGRAWGDNLQALIDAGHRVVTIDYPGFGDSPPPPAPVTIAGLAELVAGLLDRLGIQEVALAGLSMGGYVALAFAERWPQRLWALVLADTRASADSPTARQGRADALRAIEEKGVEAYLQQSVPRLLSATPPAPVLSRALELAERRAETLNAGIAALRDRPDRSDALAAIACPTLVLVGAGDQVSPPAEMRQMAQAIPSARFVEIPGAGHLCQLEAPQAFNRAVVDFLVSAGAAAARGGRS